MLIKKRSLAKLLMVGAKIMLLLLVGCNSNRWTVNSCELPCWFGVTPGTTHLRDVDDILRASPLHAMVNVSTSDQGGSFQVYRHILDRLTGADFAHGIANGTPPIVIGLWSSTEGFSTVDDFTRQFDNPTHIWAFAGKDRHTGEIFYRYEIVYLDKGFSLVWNHLEGAKPDISTDNLADYSLFVFQPGRTGYEVGSQNPARSAELKPFFGTFNFDEYCVGDGCQTD